MYNPVHPGSQHFSAEDKFRASYCEPNRPGISQFHSKLSGHQTAYQSWQHPHPNSELFHHHPYNLNHLAQTRAKEFSSSPWSPERSSSQPLASATMPYYQPTQLQQYPPHHRGYYHLHPTPRYADPESSHHPGRDTTTNSQIHPMMALHPYDTSTLTPHTQATQHSYTTTNNKCTPPPQGSLKTPTKTTPMENSSQTVVNLEPSKALLSDTMAAAASQETRLRVSVSNREQTAPPSTYKTNSPQHHLPKRVRRRSIRSSSSSKDERDDQEEDEEDKYERRRRLNRLSAQRSRERGRALIADLESQVALLQMACMDVEARAAQLEEEKEAWAKEREVLLERVKQVELIKNAAD